jgi:ribose transport system substrate-binding protein
VFTGRSAVVLGAILAGVALGACGSSGSNSSDSAAQQSSASDTAQTETKPVGLEGRPTLAGFCGKKDVSVAYVDGFGANSWRKTSLAELNDEASKCPNVKVQYFNAGGDSAKYTSAINTAIAKGVNAIVTYDDFGNAVVPALRKAFKAGIAVVPYIADPQGQPGQDYTVFVAEDLAGIGARWADFVNTALKGKGNVIMLGGTPGNTASPTYLGGYKKQAGNYAGLKLLNENPVDTNWDPVQAQRVMSGLISKYPDLQAIISDYGGGTVVGAIRAYINAGKKLPPIATGSSSNELGCLWRKYRTSNPDFQLFSADRTTYTIRIALRKAVAAAQSLKDPESATFAVPTFVDTLSGKLPPCDRSLPPDADLSSTLGKAKLATVLK